MRSIKNKLGYSCIIGISAIALSLSIINNESYSSESSSSSNDSTKCIINKNGKIVYNTESSKSDCSSSIFELYNKFETSNKAKNNGNIDTKVLGLDDIKNNQDSSGGSSGGNESSGGSGGTENPDDQDIICTGLTTQDNAEAFTSTTLKYKETPLEAKCITDETIIIKASCNSDKTWNIEGTCPTPEAQCKASDLYNNIELLGGDKTKTIDKTNVANLVKCTDNTCTEKTDVLKVSSDSTDVADDNTYYTINECISDTEDKIYRFDGATPKVLSCINGTWTLINTNNEEGRCIALTKQSKCWSATTDNNNTIDNSYSGSINVECCKQDKSQKSSYIDLDLKLKRALCEKDGETYNCIKDDSTNTYSMNEDVYNTKWKGRLREEKLIKYVSLIEEKVDLRCMDLSGLDMSQDVPEDIDESIKNLTDVKATNAQGVEDTSNNKLIHKFNAAVNGKSVWFTFGPAQYYESTTLNDGSNLSGSNFSNSNFTGTVGFGYICVYNSGNVSSDLSYTNFSNSSFGGDVFFGRNYGDSGNAGSDLTNADFSSSRFSSSVFFGENNGTSGNAGSDLTNANFSGSRFSSSVIFGSNLSNLGNAGSNLTNANFSNCIFDSSASFGVNGSAATIGNYGSIGNVGSNLTNANFKNTVFNKSVYFGYNFNKGIGNPGSNLTSADFSNSNFNDGIYFGYNRNSSGNPGSNLTCAIFEGSSFNELMANNTNTCKVKSFDTTGKLSKECENKDMENNVSDDVYNPYCALNPNDENCCAKYNEYKACEVKGWDGIH